MDAPPHSPGRPMRLETSAGPLEDGDCLNAKEFLRRCEALPQPAKVELVEGIVQLDPLRNSPQSLGPRSVITVCLERYARATPGLRFAAQPLVLLDRENVLRPDGVLQILPPHERPPLPSCGHPLEGTAEGGAQRDNVRSSACESSLPENAPHVPAINRIAGAPELMAEAIFSRGINDLRAKLAAYRRNGVREFIAWRVSENQVEWFQMDKGEYTLNLPGPNNTLSSRVFPGLVLNLTALLTHDQAGLARTLQARLNQPDHEAFVKRLAARKLGAGYCADRGIDDRSTGEP